MRVHRPHPLKNTYFISDPAILRLKSLNPRLGRILNGYIENSKKSIRRGPYQYSKKSGKGVCILDQETSSTGSGKPWPKRRLPWLHKTKFLLAALRYSNKTNA